MNRLSTIRKFTGVPSRIVAMFAFSLILTLSMSLTTHAQVDRTKQPPADPPPSATFPAFEQFTLSNGLKVFLIKDTRPLVTFRFMMRGGSGVEQVPGLAEAVAGMMTRGSAKLSSDQFAEKIDFVGGSISANADADAMNVVAGGLKKHLSIILDLFSKVMTSPNFDAAELNKYKQEQITGLKSSKADAGFLARYAVQKVLFKDSYGRMPTEESIGSLTPEMLRKHYEMYVKPNGATLAVVGNFTVAELKKMLESVFKNWRGSTPQENKGALELSAGLPSAPQTARRIILVDRPTSVQSAIRIIGSGPRYNDPERPKSTVLNSILGGGTGLGNRLAMNLRETHSYTYTPGSYFTANAVKGYFIAEADVRNSVTDSALKEALYEMDRMSNEAVPQEEFQRNVQSASGTFLMSVANPQLTASRVQFIDFYGLANDYYQKLIGVYNSTTTDDVQRLAKRYLNTQGVSIVVVGKASEVKSKLEKFGNVEVWDMDLNPADAATPTGGIAGMGAEQVWGKMLDAMGGTEKMRAITTLKVTASMSGSFGGQELSGTMTRIQAMPDKSYELLESEPFFRQETFCDGKTAVRVSQRGPETLTGEGLARQIEKAHILPQAYLKELGGSIKLKGNKEKEGKRVYVVEMTLPQNGTSTFYIDMKNFLPVQLDAADGSIIRYASWKPVAGVMMPEKMSVEIRGGIVMNVSDFNYEVNTPISDGTFQKK